MDISSVIKCALNIGRIQECKIAYFSEFGGSTADKSFIINSLPLVLQSFLARSQLNIWLFYHHYFGDGISAVADPDLELLYGGKAVLIHLPCWLFFLLSVPLFELVTSVET